MTESFGKEVLARTAAFYRRDPKSAAVRAGAVLRDQAKARLLSARLHRAHAEHMARHPAEYRSLGPLVSRYQAQGGVSHPAYLYSLVSLRGLVERYRPDAILELGSGASTAILGHYAQDQGARLVSLEESGRYHATTLELCSDLRTDGVSILLVPKQVERGPHGALEVSYLWHSDEGFDFVFVDGPSFWVGSEELQGAENSDIFRLVEKQTPRVIVVDKRPHTVTAIQNRLGHLYETRSVSGLITHRVSPGYDYFTVFERRS